MMSAHYILVNGIFIMGKNKKRNTKIAAKVRRALERYLYVKLLSFVVMIATIVGVHYGFGRYHMEAQKDKEMTEMQRMHIKELRDLDYQHQKELNAMERERDEWREKYFILVNVSNRPTNKSP